MSITREKSRRRNKVPDDNAGCCAYFDCPTTPNLHSVRNFQTLGTLDFPIFFAPTHTVWGGGGFSSWQITEYWKTAPEHMTCHITYCRVRMLSFTTLCTEIVEESKKHLCMSCPLLCCIRNSQPMQARLGPMGYTAGGEGAG